MQSITAESWPDPMNRGSGTEEASYDEWMLLEGGTELGDILHRLVPSIQRRTCHRLGYHICSGLGAGANPSPRRLASAGLRALCRKGRHVVLGGRFAPTGKVAGALRNFLRIFDTLPGRVRLHSLANQPN